MTSPTITIVGGNIDNAKGKASSVVNRLAHHLGATTIVNGGNLKSISRQLDADLNIWMANVSNDKMKEYPQKKKGSCLIVSKVVRHTEGEHKFFQPLARVFRMNANAVLAIDTYKIGESSVFEFTLIDALGNIWESTSDLRKIAIAILEFYHWSSGQLRVGSEQMDHNYPVTGIDNRLEAFLQIVRRNAQNIMTRQGDRFFGNCSTRCMLTFPSVRRTDLDNTSISCMVSARNSSKEGITVNDMVAATDDYTTTIKYWGEKKPSVDTPVQLALYRALPNINYMIHGHAFYDEDVFPTTAFYCPCGDMNEVGEVLCVVPANATNFVVNLKGHGFLIGASTLDTLSGIVDRHTPTMIPFRSINDI